MSTESKAAAQKRWYEKNKARHIANVTARRRAVVAEVRAWVRELKSTTPCTDCEKTYPYYVMDFDHLGDKEYELSAMVTHGHALEKVKAEIAKCEIVCSNCHRQRTFERSMRS